MIAIGIDGKLSEVISPNKASDILKKWINESANAVVIAKNRSIIGQRKELVDVIMNNKQIEFYSVEEVRGLEFSRALVLSEGMDNNEKYVAFTRALTELVIL